MRLLDGYHDGTRLLRPVPHRLLLALAILVVDAAGEDVGHQNVDGDVRVPPELEHHVHPSIEVFEDALHRVLARPGHKEGETSQPLQTAAQVAVAALVNVQPVEHIFRILAVQIRDTLQPVLLAELAHQLIDRLYCRFGETQGLPQQGDVLRLDLVVADLHDVVGAEAAAAGALLIQSEDGHLRRKELLQALHLPLPLLRGALPAILVMHVEDEIGRGALLDHPDQQEPGEERLAGAALAKDPVRARDELGDVEAARGLHVQGGPHVEVPLVLPSENQLHILR